MDWKTCVSKKFVVKAKPNKTLSIQMERMALVREEFLHHHIDPKFVAIKVEAYYDIIKELLSAYMYKKGYVCHDPQCLVAYLEQHLYGFKKEPIRQLFTLKQQMHRTEPKKMFEFLRKNETLLQETISLLKERLEARE